LKRHKENLESGTGTHTRVSTQIDTAQAREKRIRAIANELLRLSGAFNGSGVRQGSMYAPTNTHIMRRDQLLERLKGERSGIEELEAWRRSLK
jgi:hypothetical protein